jgi:hypothetical protein
MEQSNVSRDAHAYVHAEPTCMAKNMCKPGPHTAHRNGATALTVATSDFRPCPAAPAKYPRHRPLPFPAIDDSSACASCCSIHPI